MTNAIDADVKYLFIEQVHELLQHLYNPAVLSRSPLKELLDVPPGETSSLKEIIVDAIERLKPEPAVARSTRPWRMYKVLYHRYIEQFPQYQVGDALALSVRQIRREEKKAVHCLADELWSCYDVAHKLAASTQSAVSPLQTAAAGLEQSREREIEWIAQSLPKEVIDLGESLEAVLQVTRPLAKALDVCLVCTLPVELPRLIVEKTSLRQALINTLSTLMRTAPGGSITIDAQLAGRHAELRIRVVKGGDLDEASGRCPTDDLGTAKRLFALSNIGLVVADPLPGEAVCEIGLRFSTTPQTAVLAIDDNADTLQLLSRYLHGTPYTLTTLADPQQVLVLVERSKFDLVVLDVMLPGVDGWEVLQRLREHPRMQDVPIVVCSILPEERLALTLGASAFLRKPITRDDFLAALDRQLSLSQAAG